MVWFKTFLMASVGAVAVLSTLAAELGGNPRRVFVMGHSAGAYNAVMLALRWLAPVLDDVAGFVVSAPAVPTP
jgi:acetyl esterase/lipase